MEAHLLGLNCHIGPLRLVEALSKRSLPSKTYSTGLTRELNPL